MKNEYPNLELICGLLGQQGTKMQKSKKRWEESQPLSAEGERDASCLSLGYGHQSLRHVLGI